MSLLGLVMIVRNESSGLAATLASIKPYIDHWTLLDTGSTDGTQDIIRRELADIPGELHEEPFVDFATSRNRVLDLHGTSTTFTIMLDSDDRISGGDELRGFLAASMAYDAHLIERRGNTSWWVPLILSTASGWRYTGRVHEYVAGPAGQIASSRVPITVVTQVRGPKSISASRARWERDLQLLREDHEQNPTNPRTLFYLAQTRECLGMRDALDWYQKRIDLGGWPDETFEAMMRKANLKSAAEHPWPDVQQAYLDAYAFDASRAEPLVAVAEHYRLCGNMPLCCLFASRASELPRPRSGLFVDQAAYDWRAADLMAISAYYLSNRLMDTALMDRGRRAADKALEARPDDPRLQLNRKFYAQLGSSTM